MYNAKNLAEVINFFPNSQVLVLGNSEISGSGTPYNIKNRFFYLEEVKY
jgi:hypothetical protein